MSSIKPDKKIFLNRLLNLSLLLFAVFTVVFITLLVVKVSRGVAVTVNTPAHLIRLQVENGSGSDKSLELVENYFKDYKDDEIELKIVEKNNFRQRDIKRSFVVSREKDKKAAEIFARNIGLKDQDILFKPLENNYNQVNVTLVLGEDFEQIISKEQNKEL